MYIKSLIVIFCIFLLVLILRFYSFFQNQLGLYDGEKIKIEVVLLSEPRTTSRTQKFVFYYDSKPINVTTALYPEFHYMDTLQISGTLGTRLLDKGNSIYIMNFPIIEAKTSHQNGILSEGLAISSSFRQKIVAFFQQNLSPNYSGLLLGIVFGIKEYIPGAFLKDLKVAGVMHVIAASGMNVTLVAGFLSSMFSLFLRRQFAMLLGIVGILVYAWFAGLEPSIIRASIMGVLVFSSRIAGREAWPFYSLLLTGFVMLFVDPNLLFDIGFQLSFLATAGLLFIKPLFKNPLLDGFQTTIFAQAATLPVLLANFGTYSLWSILVNSLVLWTVPALMVIGGVSSLISFVFEPLARIMLYLSLPILIFFEYVVEFFAKFGTSFRVQELSVFTILGYYLMLLSFILKRL